MFNYYTAREFIDCRWKSGRDVPDGKTKDWYENTLRELRSVWGYCELCYFENRWWFYSPVKYWVRILCQHS